MLPDAPIEDDDEDDDDECVWGGGPSGASDLDDGHRVCGSQIFWNETMSDCCVCWCWVFLDA